MASISSSEILDYLDKKKIVYRYIGSRRGSVEGFSSLNQYRRDTLTWVKNQENWNADKKDFVKLCIVQEGTQINANNQIIVSNSKEIFFKVIEYFFDLPIQSKPVGNNTVIGRNVKIGENVIIGNNCSIVGNISIGNDTIISDNVVLKNTINIGKRCVIQSLVTIGEDGFGCYEDSNHVKTMIKHHGGVIIGDDVFIGAHTNIARGTIDDTVIKNGVKIAPSSHIGHNNQIDENVTFICSQSYGSVHIEENAYIVGSIIKNQSIIGKDSLVGMGSVVTKNIGRNKVVVGAPAREIRDNYKAD